MKIASNFNMQFSDDGNLVYFNINTRELFNVPLSYPGLLNIIKIAFRESKSEIPFKTGLLRRSYSMDRINDETVRIYFDPSKIIGSNRSGRPVDVYYPKYLKEKSKTFNWLDLIMRKFLRVLISEVRNMNKEKQKEDMLKTAALLLFYKIFTDDLKNKIKEGSGA